MQDRVIALSDVNINFTQINGFSVSWAWSKFMYIAREQPTIPHIHDVCEIYVNVDGDVSFMVENHVYPITYGDIIITKPYEYHHCIYNKDCIHEHFWILIPVEGNEHLLSCFLDRISGQNNLISLPAELRKQFLTLCYRMEDLKKENSHQLEQYSILLQLLVILDKGCENNSLSLVSLPIELSNVLNYINKNFTSIQSIKKLASDFYMSQNTLDRLFRKNLCITPQAYIEAKRLAKAKLLLLEGKTVLQACTESGFPDYSHFISKFNKQFGITPLKYRNSQLSQN